MVAEVMRRELRLYGRARFRLGSGPRMGQRGTSLPVDAMNLSDHEHHVEESLSSMFRGKA
jgi:hypothetical protein